MMTNDEDDEPDLQPFLDWIDSRDHPLAIHEAGHAVVARALGADVKFVEADFLSRDGRSYSSTFDDQVKNLAVCVAGCRAEHLLDARGPRRSKISDFRRMREALSHLPESERRPARAAGYRLANEVLRANADSVRGIAAELLARSENSFDIVRIDGDELAELLAGVQSS